MKSLQVLIIIGILLLAGGGWLVWQGGGATTLGVGSATNPASRAVASDDGETHRIVLTNDGYKPDTLSINRGDTVVFSTTRDAHHWPASNLHPTHSIYPAFDSKQPILASEEWSFTFEQEGAWRMHDHLAPYFTGIITVN